MTSSHFAHSSESSDRSDWHLLSSHLEATGDLAEAFLARAGLQGFGLAAGLLHDVGKYTQAFQRRLAGSTERVNHSTAGAKIAMERYGPFFGKLLAYCVAGHHTGLANGAGESRRTSTLKERLREEIEPLDPAWKAEVALPDKLPTPGISPRAKDTVGFSCSLWTRMVFSALVDADFLDTEKYYAELSDEPVLRGGHPPIKELARRLDRHLEDLSANAEDTPLNVLRAEVLHHVQQHAGEDPGLFTLTVPTGGGKTLTSLGFALQHALRHELQRVIYVIPYTSIIEQNAAVFRAALAGEGNEPEPVIEHHSAFGEETFSSREARSKLSLATENWDAPIVVTTAVQFFESLFSNRPSRCRKLHNMANSVVVLDEAQMLPLGYLRPCVATLDELARNWRVSIVLMTATQPALSETDGFSNGLEHVRELAPDPVRLFARRELRRTRVREMGTLSDVDLSAHLRQEPQVMCIVNTRKHARDLYALIGKEEGACHLSTLMCAAHRRERLQDVRRSLADGDPVRLISTSLIEAGVDIDFPVVWRAAAGLESIVQAAGRCNREGRRDAGNVFVFEPDESDGRRTLPGLGQLADAARTVLRKFDDPQSVVAILEYFREVYWNKGDTALDMKNILYLLEERARKFNFPFETVAGLFRFIETPMLPIIVCYEDRVRELLGELKTGGNPRRIARLLQPYTVQIPPRARTGLLAAGAAEVILEERFERQFVVLGNNDLYLPDIGLTWDDPSFRDPAGLIT